MNVWTSLFCSNVLDLLVNVVLDLLSCYVSLAYLFMLDYFYSCSTVTHGWVLLLLCLLKFYSVLMYISC